MSKKDTYVEAIDKLHKTIYNQDQKISDLEVKLAESEVELLEKKREISNLQNCEFVSTTLDFHKLSADNIRLREQIADMEANKEKEINRICKTHIEANAQLKQQLADTEAQNKRVLEKLDLIVKYNQELEKQLEKKNDEILKGDWGFVTNIYKAEQEINQLKQQLAEKDKLINAYADDLEKVANENADLVFKLAEKDELLRGEIGSLKTTDFIRMCLDCGFMVDAKDKDNQEKIELLEKLLTKVTTIDVLHQSGHYINQKKVNVVFKGEIDQLIAELKKEKK